MIKPTPIHKPGKLSISFCNLTSKKCF